MLNVFYFTCIFENKFTDDYLHLHQWIRIIHIASCNCIDHLCKIQVCLLVFIMSGNQRMGESLKRIHITFTNHSKTQSTDFDKIGLDWSTNTYANTPQIINGNHINMYLQHSPISLRIQQHTLPCTSKTDTHHQTSILHSPITQPPDLDNFGSNWST